MRARRQYMFRTKVKNVNAVQKKKQGKDTAMFQQAMNTLQGKEFTFVVDEDGIGLTDVGGLDVRSKRQSSFGFNQRWPYIGIVGWQIRNTNTVLIRVMCVPKEGGEREVGEGVEMR